MTFETIEMNLIDFLKTNPAAKPLYRKLKSRQNTKKFRIDSINTITPAAISGNTPRYNLVIPTLRKTRVFAGISAALSFLQKLAGEKARCRIIVISNEAYHPDRTFQVEGYKKDKAAPRSLWFANDGGCLEVGKNDIFIYTSWKTAFAFAPVLK